MMIEREKLERLILDRRMGELPPEVAQLLDAYLDQSPLAAQLARECDDLLGQVRDASRSGVAPGKSALPPFPGERVDRAFLKVDRRGERVWLRPALMAAAIALAFFVGTKTASPPETVTMPPNMVAVGQRQSESADGDFWSLRRYASEEDAGRIRKRNRVHWASPLAWPRIGERS